MFMNTPLLAFIVITLRNSLGLCPGVVRFKHDSHRYFLAPRAHRRRTLLSWQGRRTLLLAEVDDGEIINGEPQNGGLSSMVDELIKQAQLEAREGGVDMGEEDALAQSKRIVASMFDEGGMEMEKTAEEIKEEADARKAQLDMESEARARAETDDLMIKIERLSAGFGDAQRSPSASSNGDPSIDAALAAVEKRASQERCRQRSTTCVLVTPPGADGPIAKALEEQLRTVGWTVELLPMGLDSLATAVEAMAPSGSAESFMSRATEACKGGAVLAVCPDEAVHTSENSGGGNRGGGFLSKALGAFAGAGAGGAAPKAPLAVVDSKALQKLVGGYLGGQPSQVVLLSAAGVDRADKFPYSVANIGGSLDKRRAAEQAIVLLSLQHGFDYSILRIGSVSVLPSSTTGVTLCPGDVLDDPVTVAAVSSALVQTIVAQPAARNASFCVSGDVAVVAGTTGGIADDWDDLFLRMDGPELFRVDVSRGGTRSTDAVVVWVKNWAERWSEPNSGLTTKVRVKETTPKKPRRERPDVTVFSVGLYFDPAPGLGGGYLSLKDQRALEAERDGRAAPGTSTKPKRSRVGLEGGVELIVDSLSPFQPNKPRIRARRFAYGDGITVKEMSEDVILRRLKGDVERWNK